MGKGWSIHTRTRAESIYLFRREKGKECEPQEETVAIVNIANHRPRDTSEKLLQSETSMTTHLEAEGNFGQVGHSQMPLQGSVALQRKLPSEKRSIGFSRQGFGRAEFRDNFPSLNVVQTCGWKRKISKCTTLWPKVYTVEWGARRVCKA